MYTIVVVLTNDKTTNTKHESTDTVNTVVQL